METVNQLYERSLALYDEISKNGTVNASKTADYKARTPFLADILQKELLKASDFSKKYEYSASPIDNVLGVTTGFDIKEFKGIDLTYECLGKVTSYCFQTDGEGIAYIEDYTTQWNTLATINMTLPNNGFIEYKGIVTATTGATKSRIRFSGTYFYRTVNRALFAMPLQLSRVPSYAPWVRVDLPSAAREIVQVVTEFEDRQYTRDTQYKQEMENNTIQLYVNYYFKGKLRVQYKPIPTTITSVDDNIELDSITSLAICYGLCKWFAASEQNEYVENLCSKKFQELKADSRVRTIATVEQILDVYRVGE